MASYLGFSLTYPYQREARNPTNAGRGDGRGRLYIGHAVISDIAQNFRSTMEKICPRDRRFSAIENFANLQIADRGNELDRWRRLATGFAAPGS